MIFLRSFRALSIAASVFITLHLGASFAFADTDSPTQGWAPSAPPKSTESTKTTSKKSKSKREKKSDANVNPITDDGTDSKKDDSAKAGSSEVAPTTEKVGAANEIITPKDDASAGDEVVTLLKAVEAKYAKASAVEMSLSKTSENKLLKKKKTATGKIVLKGHGLFRMDLDIPEKSSVILDGKKLWVVQYPQDPDFDNTIRVLVSSHPKKIQTPVLTTFLMGKGSLMDDFKIVKKSTNGSVAEIEMSPKKQTPDIKTLVIKLDQAKKEIVQITMKDNVDNATEFNFDKIKFNGDVADKTFEFKAPKGAEVNEM